MKVPDAATSLMDAMMGFSLDRMPISRHMRSDASASPPPESIRSTTAQMLCGKTRTVSPPNFFYHCNCAEEHTTWPLNHEYVNRRRDK